MRFTVEHRLPGPAAAVEAVLYDADYLAALGDREEVGAPRLVDHAVEGASARYRLHYRYDGPLPPGAGRFVDGSRLTWVHVAEHELGSGHGQWRIEPDHYPGLLRSRGTVVVADDPDGDGCTRRIDGELTVRVPLVGGRVERAIVDGVRQRLDAEVDVIAEWVENTR